MTLSCTVQPHIHKLSETFLFLSGSMCQQDMSIWLVSAEGRRLLIGRSLGESGPAGVSGLTPLTPPCRPLFNERPSSDRDPAIDPPAPCNPVLAGCRVSKGLWCVVVLISGWDTGAAYRRRVYYRRVILSLVWGSFLNQHIETNTSWTLWYHYKLVSAPPVHIYVLHFASHHSDTLDSICLESATI